MFTQDRRRRLFVASEPKNSCFTWSIARPATTLTFSPADALFLNDKVHNSSSSLCLCTRKIIGHPGWCKMARRRGQLTLKVEFTGRPLMLYPQKDHNLAIRTPFELHHSPKWAELNVVRVQDPLHRRQECFGGRIQVEKPSLRMILSLTCTLPPFCELTHGQIYDQ